MIVHNPVQDNCVNKSGTSCEGRAHGRSDVISSGHHQTATQRQSFSGYFDFFQLMANFVQNNAMRENLGKKSKYPKRVYRSLELTLRKV